MELDRQSLKLTVGLVFKVESISWRHESPTVNANQPNPNPFDLALPIRVFFFTLLLLSILVVKHTQRTTVL